MTQSKIEWCDRVWNPVTGCSKISPGCQNCYAERMAKRLARRCGYPKDFPFRVTLHPERLEEPLRWRKPSRVFVCSMGDLFHDDVPDIFIVSTLAIMAEASHHTFLILTKRPRRMKEIMAQSTVAADVWVQTSTGVSDISPPIWPLTNVWLGVTAEVQGRADERIPILLQTPAAVRFVSIEPMLGPVNLSWIDLGEHVTQGYGPRRIIWDALRGWEFQYKPGKERYTDLAKAKCMVSLGARIDWVICGGESGPGARPMHPDWARSLRDQCVAAGVPFYFKQWGRWSPIDKPWEQEEIKPLAENERWLNKAGGQGFHGEEVWRVRKVSKKKAGRKLDGQEWSEFPND